MKSKSAFRVQLDGPDIGARAQGWYPTRPGTTMIAHDANPVEWALYEDGPEGDVVFSSRVRLARNVAGYPFPVRASADQLATLLTSAKQLFENRMSGPRFAFRELQSLSSPQRRAMLEAHIISPALLEHRYHAGVAYTADGKLSVMVNEEDHFRIQAIEPGLRLRESFCSADAVDDWLSAHVPYAFRPDLGYLTAHIANLGTGMRASAMVHLPALRMTGQLSAVLDAANRLDVAVRGMHGEDTAAFGDMYQVSNRYGMGRSESDILTEVEASTRHLVDQERRARQQLLGDGRSDVEDVAWRAFGILRYARSISTEEALRLLSDLLLGQSLGVVSFPARKLKHLMFAIQPGFLQVIAGPAYSPTERDIRRADLLRRAVADEELKAA
ncbi:MAG: ATP--guanido phosphotransferase [Armatimonadota bacterium]